MKLTWSEIQKIINGSASKEEVERFELWLNESEEHRIYFKKIELYYNNIEEAEALNRSAKQYSAKQIYGARKQSLTVRLLKLTIPIAACLVLLFILFNRDEKVQNMISSSEVIHSEKMTETNEENTIQLLTGDGKSYSIDTISKSEKYKNSNINVVSSKLIYNDIDTKEELPEYHTIVVPHGKTFVVELADGTSVHLNACSSLKYPTSFPKGRLREVFLTGEGFFDVEKSEKNRFVVNVENMHILVYGTKFNVNSYDDHVKTVLVEGSVAVKANGREALIVPNQRIDVAKKTGETVVTNVNVSKYIAWQKNHFMFEDERMEDIIHTIKRWYNVKIEFENETAKNILINCNTPKYQLVDDFLDVLKETGGINYSKEKGIYLIK